MKRILLLSLFCLLMLPAGAHRYPFIRTDKSVLQYPAGKSPDYELFLRKLDTLVRGGRGDVRVLHMGGSHVQGGTLSDRLRKHFLSLRYGMDGGRGLVFPFAAALTNTPVSYNTSYIGHWESVTCLKPADQELGLTGMLITAQDTSARVIVDLLPRESRQMQHRYCFNRVDILGGGELEPVLLLQGRDTLQGVVGADFAHFDLPYYTDWVQIAFRGAPGEKFALRGVYLDKSSGGFSLSEAGVNGASTLSWLHCTKWQQDLGRVHPDLIIFSIGINDIQGADFDEARFKAHYRRLMDMARRVNPHCAFLFTGINDSWTRRGVNPHTAAAEQAFRDLAKEYKAVFWDMYAVMGGAGSMAQWQEAGLAQPDKVHFSPTGYKVLGDLLFDAILESWRR